MLVLENSVMSDYQCMKSRRRPNVIKDEYVTEEQGEGIEKRMDVKMYTALQWKWIKVPYEHQRFFEMTVCSL